MGRLSSITHSFPWLSSPRGYVTYVVLPRSPLSPLRVLARLACLIHAANVHSEPGSNPFEFVFTRQLHNPVLPQSHAVTECEQSGLSADVHLGQSAETKVPLRAPLLPPTTEPIWLTYVQQPLQYSKADFSEPSNQIVKERHAHQQHNCVSGHRRRLKSECQPPGDGDSLKGRLLMAGVRISKQQGANIRSVMILRSFSGQQTNRAGMQERRRTGLAARSEHPHS